MFDAAKGVFDASHFDVSARCHHEKDQTQLRRELGGRERDGARGGLNQVEATVVGATADFDSNDRLTGAFAAAELHSAESRKEERQIGLREPREMRR